jgi:hypothetical protein
LKYSNTLRSFHLQRFVDAISTILKDDHCVGQGKIIDNCFDTKKSFLEAETSEDLAMSHLVVNNKTNRCCSSI